MTHREFVVEYPFQGARWGATIKAASMDEAQKRIEAMGAFGRVSGELMMTLPVALGWFAMLLVWWRNLGGRSR